MNCLRVEPYGSGRTYGYFLQRVCDEILCVYDSGGGFEHTRDRKQCMQIFIPKQWIIISSPLSSLSVLVCIEACHASRNLNANCMLIMIESAASGQV